MRVKFWGTRGSIPVPGRETIQYGGNTTCVQFTLQSGRIVVIDAGTGIRSLGDELAAEGGRVEIYLLMTHIHWDHVLGFPFFGPIYNSSSRIHIDGYPTCMKGLRHTFDNKMGDGFFPVKFNDLKSDMTYIDKLSKGVLEIDGTLIDCISLHHPQGGYGYRMREGDKTLVFITDNELRDDAWNGRNQRDYVEFCSGADILIHDAQYTPQEIGDRRDWGHSEFQSAFELAYRAGVKKLILFHHDPTRTDPQITSIRDRCEDLAQEKAIPMEIEAAREGCEFDL